MRNFDRYFKIVVIKNLQLKKKWCDYFKTLSKLLYWHSKCLAPKTESKLFTPRAKYNNVITITVL